MSTAEALIAKFEGFSSRAYWDVNAYRIGYGSDTEGPAQFRVTPDMTTTKLRAQQNLEARIPEFEAIASKACGAATWAALSDCQRAALISLTYNYGRLTVVIDPKDPAATAAKIKACGKDNRGINQKRRTQEANFYLHGATDGNQPKASGTAIIGAGSAASFLTALQAYAQNSTSHALIVGAAGAGAFFLLCFILSIASHVKTPAAPAAGLGDAVEELRAAEARVDAAKAVVKAQMIEATALLSHIGEK